MTGRRQGEQETPLESWKDIAAYLQRAPRTVRRWEQEEGLPVHRHRHHARSSVYAFPSELDAWRTKRGPLPEEAPRMPPWLHPAAALFIILPITISLLVLGDVLRIRLNWTPTSVMASMHKPRFRHIQIPSGFADGAKLSPDGNQLAYAREGRDVWIVPLTSSVSTDLSGAPYKLTDSVRAEGWGMAWSGDGRWIACNTWTREAAIRGIVVIPLAGGPARWLLPDSPRGGNAYSYALSLSPNGETVAFVSNDDDPEGLGRPFTSICKMPSAGGPVERIAEGYCLEPAFSPDGSWLAYARWILRGRGKEPSGELWVASQKDGKGFKICENAKAIRSPTWSPDGRMIAYLEGFGARSVWIAVVAPHGTALSRRVRLELPLETRNMIAGWPEADRIGVVLNSEQRRAIFTVPSGGGNALQITTGSHPYEPRWSPDSSRIYFRMGGKEIGWVPAQGGPVQNVPVEFDEKRLEGAAYFAIVLPGGGYDVSPDGKRIAVSALIGPNGTHIWTLPAEGGVPEQLTQGLVDDRFPCWSPDGKSIAFIRSMKNTANIFVVSVSVSVSDRSVRQMTSAIHQVVRGRPGWSPDGKWIAYFAADRTIKLLPVSGGRPRTVAGLDGPVNQYRFAEIAWAPDSRRFAFSLGSQIQVVWLNEAKAVPLETGVPGFYQGLDWSPDGERIAFQRSWGGGPELWMIEDFLRLVEP